MTKKGYRKPLEDTKYGISWRLPDGRRNPEITRKYYQVSRSKQIAKALAWQKIHPERKRESDRRLALRHPGYSTKRVTEWRKKNPTKALEIAKRQLGKRKRGLPTSTILGCAFWGSVLHHLTPDLAIYIPEDLHRSVVHNIWTDKRMAEINAKAWEFYELKGEILSV